MLQASKSSSRSTKKPSLRAQTGTSSRSPAKKPAKNVPRSRIPKNSSSRLTVHVSRDLLDDSDSGTTNRRKGRAASAKSHLAKKQSHLTRDSQARSSPRRKDKVFIPGERTSPRKRKGRGDREKGGESSVKEREGGEDVNESSVELDEDTFKKVRRRGGGAEGKGGKREGRRKKEREGKEREGTGFFVCSVRR